MCARCGGSGKCTCDDLDAARAGESASLETVARLRTHRHTGQVVATLREVRRHMRDLERRLEVSSGELATLAAERYSARARVLELEQRIVALQEAIDIMEGRR